MEALGGGHGTPRRRQLRPRAREVQLEHLQNAGARDGEGAAAALTRAHPVRAAEATKRQPRARASRQAAVLKLRSTAPAIVPAAR